MFKNQNSHLVFDRGDYNNNILIKLTLILY